MGLITKQLLDELGVEMSDQDREILSEHFETTLDERVSTEIAAELSDEQLEQLNALQQENAEGDLGVWLKENVPDLKEIIEDETAILLGEIAEGADQL